MKNLADQKQNQEPESAPLQQRAAGAPLLGMERATEIDTAGATAVVTPARSRNMGDVAFGGIVRLAVGVFLLVLVGIIAVLVVQAWPSIQWSGLSLFTQEAWDPVNNRFGAAPFLVDTIIVACVE